MSHPLYIAFVWHQHQPLYKSTGGEYRLPWVRLHGTKDYLDLILILERYPQLHQTVNLVPSLILQLEDYIAGKAIDPYLAVALTDEKKLNREQQQFIIDHFFDGNHHTLVDPHPRYAQLYHQRQEKGATWCLDNWQADDYGDLLAWHNLVWIDPLFWDDPQIATWLKKEKGFTLEDRQGIYRKQREIIGNIIPKHREMQEAGQLEVTTTPYTHPILPLLADTHAGRVAVPNMALPKNRFQWPEDIPRHLRKAKEVYRERFVRNPRGLWPSEQSVSPAILPHIAKEGFKWICSDEAVLGWSLDRFFHRDEGGNLYDPEVLYRPYRLETPYGDVAIAFRDHRLSDLIGFTYSTMSPQDAARDLIGHLQAIDRSRNPHENEPWLVTIALDGENCWEFYQQDGLPFLDCLYQHLSNDNNLELVTVSEFLTKFPPTQTIPLEKLHSGSWVDGSFTTWIGDPVKNRAWDLLYEARATLDKHPEATEEKNPKAWEALYAAEGSDWFWWFGEGHSSNQDAMFDRLFREHLMELYEALGEPIPDTLEEEVERHNIYGDRVPSSFIHPFIDGFGDEQDWDKAGLVEIGGARGTMHQSSTVQRLFYGLDHLNFYLRLDFKTGIDVSKELPSELHLLWFYPGILMSNNRAPLPELPDIDPLNYEFHHHLGINLRSRQVWLDEAGEFGAWHRRKCSAYMALNQCLELAIPWHDLDISPDYPVRMVGVLTDGGKFSGQIPENRLISFNSP
ncbi:MAG: glycoside hydrolase [Cyanobacteria bacterium P01_E01_bin.42]